MIAGGSNAGKMCHFPFEYGGTEHNQCIMDNSIGQPWCSSSKEFSNDTIGNCSCFLRGKSSWSNCIIIRYCAFV